MLGGEEERSEAYVAYAAATNDEPTKQMALFHRPA